MQPILAESEPYRGRVVAFAAALAVIAALALPNLARPDRRDHHRLRHHACPRATHAVYAQ